MSTSYSSANDKTSMGKETGAGKDDMSAEVKQLRKDFDNLSRSAKNAASSTMDNARGVAEHTFEAAQEKAAEGVGELERAIRRNPLTAAGIAAGVGFLFGAIISR